jgi:hypothetical protein
MARSKEFNLHFFIVFYFDTHAARKAVENSGRINIGKILHSAQLYDVVPQPCQPLSPVAMPPTTCGRR